MERCQRCGEVEEDRRTLWMACFYEMDELDMPFKHEILSTHIQDSGRKFYTLRVCKQCRGQWMGAIKDWFENVKKNEACGSGIYVRENGATIEISNEEWERRHPGVEPVRFLGNDHGQ